MRHRLFRLQPLSSVRKLFGSSRAGSGDAQLFREILARGYRGSRQMVFAIRRSIRVRNGTDYIL